MCLITQTCGHLFSFCFFFNDTATTEIYTLSLHDALPIFARATSASDGRRWRDVRIMCRGSDTSMSAFRRSRSEEHTSELQSHLNLVCRLLLEKKKYPKLNKCKRQLPTPHYPLPPIPQHTI